MCVYVCVCVYSLTLLDNPCGSCGSFDATHVSDSDSSPSYNERVVNNCIFAYSELASYETKDPDEDDEDEKAAAAAEEAGGEVVRTRGEGRVEVRECTYGVPEIKHTPTGLSK